MKIDLSGLKLLVVDDEIELTELLKDDLESFGATVVTANGGRAGYEAYLKHQPHVILSDVRMPGGDGVEMLTKIRSDKRDSPPHCFMMSGYSAISRDQLFKLGAQGFIAKPFRMQEIRVLVSSFK